MGTSSNYREWQVASGLIEFEGRWLLVRNHRHGGHVDWSPPGGVVDSGESILEGLSREVTEETGLVVEGWRGPLYEVHAVAPDLGWNLSVQVHLAVAYDGDLVVDDPDGIVRHAAFFDPEEFTSHLSGGPRWVREPVSDWLASQYTTPRQYSYRVEGIDLSSLKVSRL